MTHMKMAIGLGSNLGDREAALRNALAALGARVFTAAPIVSGTYESDALLPPGAPVDWNIPFLNCAAIGDTALLPEEALSQLQGIERQLGRARRDRWAPREIDLDILAWDGPTVETRSLRVPHPGLPERPFALLPLLEIWPDWPGPRAWLAQADEWGLHPERVPFRTRRLLGGSFK